MSNEPIERLCPDFFPFRELSVVLALPPTERLAMELKEGEEFTLIPSVE